MGGPLANVSAKPQRFRSASNARGPRLWRGEGAVTLSRQTVLDVGDFDDRSSTRPLGRVTEALSVSASVSERNGTTSETGNYVHTVLTSL